MFPSLIRRLNASERCLSIYIVACEDGVSRYRGAISQKTIQKKSRPEMPVMPDYGEGEWVQKIQNFIPIGILSRFYYFLNFFVAFFASDYQIIFTFSPCHAAGLQVCCHGLGGFEALSLACRLFVEQSATAALCAGLALCPRFHVKDASDKLGSGQT